MPMFRKKPVTIEARQFTGRNFAEIESWVIREGGAVTRYVDRNGDPSTLTIDTLEGVHLVSDGDWVIKGVKGEFYPCKPDIFALTYDAVESAHVDDPADGSQ